MRTLNDPDAVDKARLALGECLGINRVTKLVGLSSNAAASKWRQRHAIIGELVGRVAKKQRSRINCALTISAYRRP
jgi:hypothetical protein